MSLTFCWVDKLLPVLWEFWASTANGCLRDWVAVPDSPSNFSSWLPFSEGSGMWLLLNQKRLSVHKPLILLRFSKKVQAWCSIVYLFLRGPAASDVPSVLSPMGNMTLLLFKLINEAFLFSFAKASCFALFLQRVVNRFFTALSVLFLQKLFEYTSNIHLTVTENA